MIPTTSSAGPSDPGDNQIDDLEDVLTLLMAVALFAIVIAGIAVLFPGGHHA